MTTDEARKMATPYTEQELRVAKALFLDGYGGWADAEKFWDAGCDAYRWDHIRKARVAIAALPTPSSADETVGDDPRQLEMDINAVRTVLAFFPSVIKSGESWSRTCDDVLCSAKLSLTSIEAHLSRRAAAVREQGDDAAILDMRGVNTQPSGDACVGESEIVDMLHTEIDKSLRSTSPPPTSVPSRIPRGAQVTDKTEAWDMREWTEAAPVRVAEPDEKYVAPEDRELANEIMSLVAFENGCVAPPCQRRVCRCGNIADRITAKLVADRIATSPSGEDMERARKLGDELGECDSIIGTSCLRCGDKIAQAFASIRQSERERCAKIADEYAKKYKNKIGDCAVQSEIIAAAIRSPAYKTGA